VTAIEVKIHASTPYEDLFAAFARVFGSTTSPPHRWVQFTHDGVAVTVYGPPVLADEEVAE